jgi:hypothetical protein
MTATDLLAAAEVLTRAADQIEKQTQGAGGPRGRWYSDREYVWLGEDRIDAENQWDADYIATFDPTTLAALVPLLRMVADWADQGKGPIASSVQHHLAEFARRLLREEESTDG